MKQKLMFFSDAETISVITNDGRNIVVSCYNCKQYQSL